MCAETFPAELDRSAIGELVAFLHRFVVVVVVLLEIKRGIAESLLDVLGLGLGNAITERSFLLEEILQLARHKGPDMLPTVWVYPNHFIEHRDITPL